MAGQGQGAHLLHGRDIPWRFALHLSPHLSTTTSRHGFAQVTNPPDRPLPRRAGDGLEIIWAAAAQPSSGPNPLRLGAATSIAPLLNERELPPCLSGPLHRQLSTLFSVGTGPGELESAVPTALRRLGSRRQGRGAKSLVLSDRSTPERCAQGRPETGLTATTTYIPPVTAVGAVHAAPLLRLGLPSAGLPGGSTPPVLESPTTWLPDRASAQSPSAPGSPGKPPATASTYPRPSPLMGARGKAATLDAAAPRQRAPGPGGRLCAKILPRSASRCGRYQRRPDLRGHRHRPAALISTGLQGHHQPGPGPEALADTGAKTLAFPCRPTRTER